jgi:hypothetical protein
VDVSLIQLIATPLDFDGRLVRVIGYCHLEFEGDALYVHQQDFERAISKNGVWLDLPASPTADRDTLSDEYVLVEAIFSAKDHGHLGSFSGTLTEVQRIHRWPDREEMQAATGGVKQ